MAEDTRASVAPFGGINAWKLSWELTRFTLTLQHMAENLRGWDTSDSKIIVKDAAYSEGKNHKFLDSILTKGQDNNDSNEAENI